LKSNNLLLRFIKTLFKIFIWPFKIALKILLYPFKKFFGFVFSPFRKLWDIGIRYLKELYFLTREKVRESIRLELIVVFGICLFSAFIVFSMANSWFEKTTNEPYIDYENGKTKIAAYADDISRKIIDGKISIKDESKVNEIISSYGEYSDLKVLITNLEGKVLFRSSNASENEIDVYNLIKNFMESNLNKYSSSSYNKTTAEGTKEFIAFYPVNFIDGKSYLIVKGIPEPKLIPRAITSKNSFMALLVAGASFVLLFVFVTNKKMKYVEEISSGLKEISKGDLSFRVDKKGKDELSTLASNINYMAEEIQIMIEKERRAEKAKNELITNVSHDLRTPLTSVMGYLGLIKDKKYESEEQMLEYLNIASSKAEKLKVLIEALFEYTKLTNDGIELKKQQVNINELIEQLVEELIPIFDENNIEIIKNIPSEKLYLNIDSDKMVRVFENILMNAVKYGYKPGQVTVNVYKQQSKLIISISNRGDHIEEEELEKLFDRFYRVDKARSTASGGSGLGLAIAKSIVELHHGSIWAKSEGNLTTFIVELI
jgi:signal transduction histidine kinase